MRDINSLTKSKMERTWALNSSMAHEPASMKDATQQVVHILDAKYEKSRPPISCIYELQAPTPRRATKVTGLLMEYEDLFDGTLGDWKTEPVSFELNEGAKPYHGKPYLVPRIHKQTTRKKYIAWWNWGY